MNKLIEKSKIKKYLKEELSERRYKHSLNVSHESMKLAVRYGVDVDKAEIAGLIHDCTKEMSVEAQMCYLNKYSIELDIIFNNIKELLHGQSGCLIAREVFEINDEEILSGIKYHITGKENMSLLEKIIYLADYIEPQRNFKEVVELRKLAYKNIDLAMIKALNMSIKHMVSKNKIIHPDTVLARNYIIQRLGMLT